MYLILLWFCCIFFIYQLSIVYYENSFIKIKHRKNIIHENSLNLKTLHCIKYYTMYSKSAILKLQICIRIHNFKCVYILYALYIICTIYILDHIHIVPILFKFGVGLKRKYFMVTEACIYLIKKTV